MDNDVLISAKKALQNAQRVLIASHTRPDGDAVGSTLGLGLALQAIGKEVQMALADGVPKTFRHLQGADQITKKPDGEFDVTVVLDSSDLMRAGKVIDQDSIPTLNIDHHITNTNFADINLVKTNATATAEVLAQHMKDFGLEITTPVAEALLTGLLTDTLGFRTTNMTPNAFRVAADLMEYGCDLPNLYRKALVDLSFEAIKYWGSGLSTVQLEDRLLWAELTLQARKNANYPGRDDADLINILSSVNDIDVSIIFIEQDNGTVKVSWRANQGFDVSKIAYSFGGGGHKPAAGAEIVGELDQVRDDVLHATRQLFDPNNGNKDFVNAG